MPKWRVTAMVTTLTSLEVEADTEGEAIEKYEAFVGDSPDVEYDEFTETLAEEVGQ